MLSWYFNIESHIIFRVSASLESFNPFILWIIFGIDVTQYRISPFRPDPLRFTLSQLSQAQLSPTQTCITPSNLFCVSNLYLKLC